MAGYPRLSQISDQATRALLKSALDQIQQLKSELAALSAVAVRNNTALDANDQRVRRVANPDALTDAVNVQYLRTFSQANLEAFKGSLGVDGTIDTTAAQLVTVKNGLITNIA